MRRLLPFLLLCAALSAGPKPDTKPAELNLVDTDGKKVHLRDLRGQIVVLNFWATWCGPCKEEMPMLVEADKEYQSKGVKFVGVSLDDDTTRSQVPSFLSRFHLGFDIWLGGTADHMARLKMGEAVPATAFLDKEGRIVARISGEFRKPELTQRIDWLLSGGAGPAPEPMVVHLGGK